MRASRIFVASLVGVAAIAALAYSCGGYATKVNIKSVRPVNAAMVRDGKLYATSDNGDLLRLDSMNGAFTSLGRFDGELLDVAGDRACFAVRNLVYVADLKRGTVLTAQVRDRSDRGICFVGPERLAVPKGNKVEIIDAGTGKVSQTIALADGDQKPASALACRSDGERLFVAAAGRKASVTVIDLQKNKITDRIEVELGFGVQEFHLQGDKALLVGHNHGAYGAWMYQSAVVDLKTRQVSHVKLATRLHSDEFAAVAFAQHAGLAVGPANSFCVYGPNGVFQYDAKGTLVGPALPKGSGRVLTVWNRRAVLADKTGIEIVRLAVE